MKERKFLERLSLAAKNGFYLALISIVLLIFQQWVVNNWLANHTKTVATLLNMAIWLLKTWASLWLLYFFIKADGIGQKLYSYGEGFRYGSLIALCSSFLIAAILLLHNFTLFPHLMEEQIGVALALYANNPEMETIVERMTSKLPAIFFWGSFIYYTLFGVIASSVMANYTKKDNIFLQ